MAEKWYMACTCLALYQVSRDPKSLYTTTSHSPIHTHMHTFTNEMVAHLCSQPNRCLPPSLTQCHTGLSLPSMEGILFSKGVVFGFALTLCGSGGGVSDDFSSPPSNLSTSSSTQPWSSLSHSLN
ncbi:hypothetical protein AMECASPLE_038057 [Ameca splendens]|uniref:Uncharacterized protein n=1 Tax=Ameca splendens TaxID=208324 RepID=A0ABV0Z6W0_9TELE